MSRIILLAVFTTIIIVSISFAGIEPDWENRVGSSNEEQLNCSVKTSDGGWLLAGMTDEFELHDRDILILKLNENLEEEWHVRYDNYTDQICHDAIQTSDGGFLIGCIGGRSDAEHSGNRFLIKINPDGEILWVRDYFMAGSRRLFRIFELSDGTVALAHEPEPGVRSLPIKYLNPAGELIDEHAYLVNYSIYDLTLTEDNNFIASGITNDGMGFRVIKFTLEDEIIFNTVVGDSIRGYRSARVIQTGDNGFALTTFHTSAPYGRLIKFDTDGRIEWRTPLQVSSRSPLFSIEIEDRFLVSQVHNEVFTVFTVDSEGEISGQSNFSADEIGFNPINQTDIHPTNDGGFSISGTSGFQFGSYGDPRACDFMLLEFDSEIDLTSTARFGNPGGSIAFAGGLVKCADGGYVLGIYSEETQNADPEVILMRTDEQGNDIWSRNYKIPEIKRFIPWQEEVNGSLNLIDNFNEGFFLIGEYENQEGEGIWILKTNEDGDSLWTRYYSIFDPERWNRFANVKTIMTSDSTLIIANPFSGDNRETILRINRDGRAIAEFISEDYRARDIVEKPEGGFAALTWGGILQFDSELNPVDTMRFNDGGWGWEYEHVLLADNGGYFVSCQPHDCGCTHAMVILYDRNGDRVWLALPHQQTYGFLYPHSESKLAFIMNGSDFYIIDKATGHIDTTAEGRPRYARLYNRRNLHSIVAEEDGYTVAGQQAWDAWIGHIPFDQLPAPSERYPILHPSSFTLSQPYPNPFNSTTTIKYTVTLIGGVSLRVFDVQGRLVETLVDGIVPAGMHSAVWDAEGVGAGVYFVKLESGSGEKNEVQKLMLLK